MFFNISQLQNLLFLKIILFLMSSFFNLYTLTNWDGLNTNELTCVKVLSLKSIFKKFPVIETSFFDDLKSNISNYNHYSHQECIRRITGPNNEDYDISSWIFVWAQDIDSRTFQFLIQKTEKQGILVALAPPELAKLFTEYGKGAIVRTFSLLNNPSKIKFLMLLTPKGKSIAEDYNRYQTDKNRLEKMKVFDILANKPNIQGQWFPSFEPRCPVCNELLTELQDYRLGFGKLTCKRCGYEKIK